MAGKIPERARSFPKLCLEAAGGEPELALILAVDVVRALANGTVLLAEDRFATVEEAAQMLGRARSVVPKVVPI